MAYLGEIRPFAGALPMGWLPCDGQLLDVRNPNPVCVDSVRLRWRQVDVRVARLRGRVTAGADESKGQLGRPRGRPRGRGADSPRGCQLGDHGGRDVPRCAAVAADVRAPQARLPTPAPARSAVVGRHVRVVVSAEALVRLQTLPERVAATTLADAVGQAS